MAHSMRARFLHGFWDGIKIVWPILSGLLVFMATLRIAVAVLEGWRLGDGLYFAFVSGLTIGYGDLVPKLPLTRALAVTIGFTGILLTGLVAAVGVQALQAALRGSEER